MRTPCEKSACAVDTAIVATVLPECYRIIKELLTPDTPKDIQIKAMRLLPEQYGGFKRKKRDGTDT